MLTTSKEDEDRIRSYNLGATAFIAKHIGYEHFAAAVKAINRFWALVEIPD
jgi:two-component system response regulator